MLAFSQATCPRCGEDVGISSPGDDVWCWYCGKPFRAVPPWLYAEEHHARQSDIARRCLHIVRAGSSRRAVEPSQPDSGGPSLLGARYLARRKMIRERALLLFMGFVCGVLFYYFWIMVG